MMDIEMLNREMDPATRKIIDDLKAKNQPHYDKMAQLEEELGPCVGEITPYRDQNPIENLPLGEKTYFFLQEKSLAKHLPLTLERIKSERRTMGATEFVEKYRPYILEVPQKDIPPKYFWVG